MVANATQRNAGRPSALLIEDDLVHGALARMILDAAGIQVFVASTQQEALEILGDARPSLVLVAWDIDGIDGRTMLLYLRAHIPALARIPAVLMTDRAVNARTRIELSIEGYQWILQKPIVMTSLPRLVQRTVTEARATSRDGQPMRQHSVRLVDCATAASSVYMEAVR